MLPKGLRGRFETETDGEEYVSGSDGSSFNLDNLSGMNVDMSTAERGRNHYVNERVAYISVDGAKGYVVVEGSKAYEVEFEYRGGEISRLTYKSRRHNKLKEADIKSIRVLLYGNERRMEHSKL